MIPIEIIKNRLGIASLPSFCNFIVTWQCNLQCKMCEVWKKPKEEVMTPQEIANIFKQHRFDAIKLIGGEPFLRKDLVQIARAIQRYNPPRVLHITSNGVMTDRILAFFNEVGPAKNIHIKISIDAVGRKHDEIRGVPSVYRAIITTLSELVKLREKLGFYVGINLSMLDKDGLQNYRQVKEIGQRWNVPIHGALGVNPEIALYLKEKNVSLLPKKGASVECFDDLPKNQIAEMLNVLKEDAEFIPDFKEKLVRRYYLKGLYNRLVKKKDSPKPACVALNNHLRILPNGDVPICFHNSTVVGNLRETSLRDLWFSEKMKQYRQIVRQCPGCWTGCEIIPSAIYTGDLIKGLFK